MDIKKHAIKFLPGMSLQGKFLLGTVMIVLSMGAAIILFVQTTLTQKLSDELQKRGATIVKSIAKESAELVLTDRTVDIQLLINAYLGAEEDIEYIFIQGPEGSILAHTFQGLFPSDLKNANEASSAQATSIQQVILGKINILDFAVQILHGGAWVVRVGISEEPIKKDVNHIINLILLVILAVVLLGSGAAVAYSHVITKPISELTKAAESFGRGDLKQKVRIRTRDEIGQLAAVFNNMIAERKKAENALMESESKLRSITDTANDSIILIDNEGLISYWNPSAERMFGYSKEEIEGRNISIIIPEKHSEEHKTAFYRFANTGHIRHLGGKSYEITAVRKNGREFPIELSVSGVMLQGRWHAAGIIRDITDRKHLESQLLHIQKMEAIGTLAGGIAHDFNNIMNIIIGYADITQRAIKEDDPLRSYLDEILSAAERAAHLTKSLLAFGRKQIYDPKPVNLNDIVYGMKKMLSRIIGADIELKTIITDKDLTVMADNSQIEQVLMNLATNARAAMKQGGILIIETGFTEIDRAFLNMHQYGTPGK